VLFTKLNIKLLHRINYAAKPLSEEAEVYQLLETDLTAIQNDLPWTFEGDNAGRANTAMPVLFYLISVIIARIFS